MTGMRSSRRLAPAPLPPFVVASIHRGAASGARPLVQSLRLTPYAAESLAEAARRSGSARVELVLRASANDEDLAWARRQMAGLAARGVPVVVRRAGDATAPESPAERHLAR